MHAHIQARINKIQRGEVPEGYQKTKVGIIPDEWAVKKIQDIAPLQRGFDLPNQNLIPGQYPVAYSNGVLNFHADFKVKGPGVFTGRSGTIGKIFYIEENYWPHNTTLWVTDFRGNDPKFIYYFYQSVNLLRFNAGTSVPTLNRNDVHLAQAPLPPLFEQCKIAEILSAWDDAIRLQHELIEQKNTQKRGLMQLLLTGAIRVTEMGKLSPEAVKKRAASIHQGHIPDGYQKIQWAITPNVWNFLEIKDVAQQVVEFNSANEVKKVLSCTKYDGLVDSLTYFKRQVFSEDLSTYKIVRKGHFAYATNHIEEGSIGLQNIYEAGLVSPMYTVFKTQPSMLAEFLYAVLKTETYRKIFEVQTSASINRRGSLRWNQFSQIRVPVPAIEEQSKIVDILATADKEIELLEAELDHLRAQKTGLMQLLLTGVIRVHEGAGHNNGFEEKTD